MLRNATDLKRKIFFRKKRYISIFVVYEFGCGTTFILVAKYLMYQLHYKFIHGKVIIIF